MKQTEFMKRAKAAGLSKEDILALGSELVASFAEDQIADGTLDPTGKSATEIAVEVGRRIRKKLTKGCDVVLITSHQNGLLEQARSYRQKNKSEYACLFYATWLEHWVNLLLVRSRSGLNSAERQQMLRELSFRAKFSWMLSALGYPRIPASHLNRVARISEGRNAFVHYKWQGKPMERDDADEARMSKELQGIEGTIRYLVRFEDRHLLKGSRKILAEISPKARKKR
jgi:hypothetical protein